MGRAGCQRATRRACRRSPAGQIAALHQQTDTGEPNTTPPPDPPPALVDGLPAGDGGTASTAPPPPAAAAATNNRCCCLRSGTLGQAKHVNSGPLPRAYKLASGVADYSSSDGRGKWNGVGKGSGAELAAERVGGWAEWTMGGGRESWGGGGETARWCVVRSGGGKTRNTRWSVAAAHAGENRLFQLSVRWSKVRAMVRVPCGRKFTPARRPLQKWTTQRDYRLQLGAPTAR